MFSLQKRRLSGDMTIASGRLGVMGLSPPKTWGSGGSTEDNRTAQVRPLGGCNGFGKRSGQTQEGRAVWGAD